MIFTEVYAGNTSTSATSAFLSNMKIIYGDYFYIKIMHF